MRSFSDEFTFFDAVAANGVSRAMFVKDYRHASFNINTASNADGLIQAQISTSETAPDFSAPSSPTNRWDLVQIRHMDTGSTINGTAGVSPGGSDIQRTYEVQFNGATWLSFELSSFVAGTFTVKGTAYGE